MANDIRFNRTASIQQMQELLKQSQKTGANAQAQGTSFEEMLALKREAVREVKFSKHATERLDDRDITITDEQMQRLNNGVKQAETKGINESLVMVDDIAFIVNVKNNTVVTAVTGDDTKVFSNIDGAVIA
ncbi:MAG: flagellar protein [Lachnospiraceae bacterium]|nr:flagellar protein [Lachnospiraceae bacterium]MBP5250096.1 flagellar protein [Lachnospiraceae bacterium]